MRKLKRAPVFKTLLALILLIVLAATGSAAYLFLRAMPDYAGNASLPGLSAPVHVVRDAHGVPHIFAANMNDAARALGYVHASERFFQMEMQRRAGQGRLSEITGPDTLGIDKYIRTLGLYNLAESSAASMSPEAQAYLQAYADGVNAWLDTHAKKLPPEFLILGDWPEPWKPADSIVWGKLMALQLSKNYKLEMLRAELAKKLSPDQMNAIFAMSADVPITTEPEVKGRSSMQEQSIPLPLAGGTPSYPTSLSDSSPQTQLGALLGLDHPASNEWVISGAHTLSGKPILANDPHLGLEAPILWYLVRIVTPELSIKGATVPGLPVILLGQNDHIAWGFTTTGSDVQDIFIETVDPANPANYLTPDGSKPFEARTETIHVKGAADVVLNVRSTLHGPVMSDIDAEMAALAGKGKVMALAFTALGSHDRTSEALMYLNRAKNHDEFLAALHMYQAPPQNLVYADTEGHIGFISPGYLPVRKNGNGLVPADGASGDYEWTHLISFDDLPQIYDPSAGFIFNANNAIVGANYPYFIGADWEEPYRAERLRQYFSQPGKHTLDTSAEMQADDISLAARQLLPYLLGQPPTGAREEQALHMLNKWNGAMDAARPEPLIFEAWLYEMHRLLLVEKTGNALEEKGPYDAEAIAFILAHDGKDFCADADCRDVIIKALDDALDLLTVRDGADMHEWRWGKEHVTQLRNKFWSHVPVLNWLSRLDVPSRGDYYTLDRGGSFDPKPDAPFVHNHGGGYRGIYDLGDPAQSRFMIATGESGHVFSRHYGDLVKDWNDVKSFTLSGTEEELKAKGLPELVLTPR